MECRDDLLDTAVVLDALALCHGPGAYLPRPYQEISIPAPRDVELRTAPRKLARSPRFDEAAVHTVRAGTPVDVT